MEIIEDSRQQHGKHKNKELYFAKNEIIVNRCVLPYGDYMLMPEDYELRLKIYDLRRFYENHQVIPTSTSKSILGALTALHSHSIDTKQNMNEVYSNIVHQHKRFANECELGGKDLTILIEDDEISCLNDLNSWRLKVPRSTQSMCKKPPMSGVALKKAMITMSNRYGIKWEFCKKKNAGARIVEILKSN